MRFKTLLFTGTLSESGHLSNEDVLRRICAAEFAKNSDWYKAAEALMTGRLDLSSLTFTSKDPNVQRQQTRFIDAMIMRGSLPPAETALLAGMLAETYVSPT